MPDSLSPGTTTNEPTRTEHLAWCKERALAYVEVGDMHNAFASFASDMGKHPETAPQCQFIAAVGMPMLLGGLLDSPDEMRRFIEGFR